MSMKSKIQSLIAAANAKTGETDTTLTDAVQTLCDGYGQGGEGGGSSGGATWSEITVSQDCNTFGDCVSVIKSAGYTSGLVVAVFDGTPAPERNKNHLKYSLIPNMESPYSSSELNSTAKYSNDADDAAPNAYTYGKLAQGTNCYLDAGETIKVTGLAV